MEQQVRDLGTDVETLTRREHTTRVIEEVALAPVALLVAILALGGGLGIVFSIRDQRRVSQLHELTVAGEVSSQRRAEQGYASFLDQSQTTLALVNDTLRLAKEATDREARSMDLKAQQRIDAIEDKAHQLMLEAFTTERFGSIVEDPVRRERLHAVAGELGKLEGYLSLQNVTLPPYTRFVKAIDQFLSNDPDTAISALRRAAQEPVVSDLHRFILYWLGYMLTTVGAYDEAVGHFEDDELGLPEKHPEHIQLDRVIVETEFFDLAKKAALDDPLGQNPRARFRVAARKLDRLHELACKVKENEELRAKREIALEIARTRADILEWIAYDHDHLDVRIDEDDKQHAVPLARRHFAPLTSASAFMDSPAWEEMEDPDTFRAWALLQAEAICVEQAEGNEHDFSLAFALAECQFKLGEDDAEASFVKAESLLHKEHGLYREQRREASLKQSMLICHSRLLSLRHGNTQERADEARIVTQAHREAQEVLGAVRPAHVTVFSHIQRRNLTQEEFRKEVGDIFDQERKAVEGAAK